MDWFLRDTAPSDWVIGDRRFEAVQLPHLQGSTTWRGVLSQNWDFNHVTAKT